MPRSVTPKMFKKGTLPGSGTNQRYIQRLKVNEPKRLGRNVSVHKQAALRQAAQTMGIKVSLRNFPDGDTWIMRRS